MKGGAGVVTIPWLGCHAARERGPGIRRIRESAEFWRSNAEEHERGWKCQTARAALQYRRWIYARQEIVLHLVAITEVLTVARGKNTLEETFPEEVELAFSAEDEGDLEGITHKTLRDMIVVPTDWTVGTMCEQIRSGNIDLSPRYQRRDAWTSAKKSKFIESLFLRLPVPQIVLAETRPGSYAVIDGKQRLLSLQKFAIDGLESGSFPLIGLTLLKELNGKTLLEISNSISFREDFNVFWNSTIRTIVVRNWKDERLLYLLFLRLNQNSVSLSPQELRGALHPGPFTDFVEDWSQRSLGLKTIFPRLPDFRMRDVELSLRCFAFGLFAKEYSGNMRLFLDLSTKELNGRWNREEKKIASFATDLDEAFLAADRIFEGQPFRKFSPEKNRFEGRINRALLDVVVYSLLNKGVRHLAVQKKDQVCSMLIDLCKQNQTFVSSIESTTKSLGATYDRFEIWCSALGSVLNSKVDLPKIRKK